MYKKIKKYFAGHPVYNACTHLLAGVGIGVLITYPFVGIHPVRWGLIFVGLGIICHLYPLWIKK